MTDRVTGSLAMLAAACFLTLPEVRPAASQSKPPQGWVRVGGTAYVPDSPEVVVDGAEIQAGWSDSGNFILASAARLFFRDLASGKPPGPDRLVLWSAATGEARVLSRSAPPGRLRFAWFRGRDRALVVGAALAPRAERDPRQPPEQALHWLDARTATFRFLRGVDPSAGLLASPTGASVLVTSPAQPLLFLVLPDGRIKDLLPLTGGRRIASASWFPDGRTLHLRSTGPGKPAFWTLDTAGGTLLEAGERPEPRPAAAGPVSDAPLRLREGAVQAVDAGRRYPAHPLWLEAADAARRTSEADSAALLSSDATDGQLSPSGNAVLYVSGGALWVRRLVQMNPALLDAARSAAERVKAISDLKQIGVALHQFAQDNDGRLPGFGDADQALRPYFKEDVLSGFQYTHAGGLLKEIAEPGKAVLGFRELPTGRVQLFADGHVTFEPNP